MKKFLSSILIMCTLIFVITNEAKSDFPTVNDLFAKAYYSDISKEEKSFWIGASSARCSAASGMAASLNANAERIFGTFLKGYIGNEPPEFWNKLENRSKDISLFTFEGSGITSNASADEFEKFYDMSARLYLYFVEEVDEEGLPDIRMLLQDLDDCKSFFGQDFKNPSYLPKP